MSEFKVLKESNRLRHADVTVHLEAHVSDWISGVNVPDYILRDDIQSRRLVGNGGEDSDRESEENGDRTS